MLETCTIVNRKSFRRNMYATMLFINTEWVTHSLTRVRTHFRSSSVHPEVELTQCSQEDVENNLLSLSFRPHTNSTGLSTQAPGKQKQDMFEWNHVTELHTGTWNIFKNICFCSTWNKPHAFFVSSLSVDAATPTFLASPALRTLNGLSFVSSFGMFSSVRRKPSNN